MSEISAYADVLVATVQNLLPKGSENAFIVSVRMEYDDTSADQPCVGGFLHLMCYAPNNYMRVYAAFTERPTANYANLPWVNVCNHDSAWRDDGIRSQLRQAFKAVGEEAASVFGKSANLLSAYLLIDKMSRAPARELGVADILTWPRTLGVLDVRKALA